MPQIQNEVQNTKNVADIIDEYLLEEQYETDMSLQADLLDIGCGNLQIDY